MCWLWGEGGVWLGGNPTIQTKNFTKLIFLTFKKKKIKYIFTSLKKICDFFSKLGD